MPTRLFLQPGVPRTENSIYHMRGEVRRYNKEGAFERALGIGEMSARMKVFRTWEKSEQRFRGRPGRMRSPT